MIFARGTPQIRVCEILAQQVDIDLGANIGDVVGKSLRRGGRDGGRRDDAHGRRARVVAVRHRVRRPERLAAHEPLVAVDRRDELRKG